jgi:23S rRNA pseudouridine2605 synthase
VQARVSVARALSKLGILSRTQATEAIAAGRVRIDGRVVTDPSLRIVPERVRIEVDGRPATRTASWRAIILNKPRGVVTTRRDPEGRRTVFDVLGHAGAGLVAVGRLDLATTGLLLLTSDTQLANWIADPANAVPRVYVATVRGRIRDDDLDALTRGVVDRGETLAAHAVTILKSSNRESHVRLELREGKNREIRRLFKALGHEVTRLKRISLGGLGLGDLAAGEWRELTRSDLRRAFPGAAVRREATVPAEQK